MNRRIENILPEDMQALVHHGWPGNVRELQNVVERSMVVSSGSVLSLSRPTEPRRTDAGGGKRTLAEAERDHLLQALRNADWVVGRPHAPAAGLGGKRTRFLYEVGP